MTSQVKDYLGLAIISGVNFKSLSRKIKSHEDNCQECSSLLLEPFYDVGKWLLCPWLQLPGLFMVQTAACSGGRREHYLPFPGTQWSLPFPAAKPYVVLVLSKFSGTELPPQLGFTFHFVLSGWWYHLSQIYFCNLCYIPQPWVHSNRGTDLEYCSASSGWHGKTKDSG